MGGAQAKPKTRRSSVYLESDKIESSVKTTVVPVHTHYYGKGKPNSPDGKDFGLQEIWEGWDFPQSSKNCVIIRPRWVNMPGSAADFWSQTSVDPTYPPALAKPGITETDYTAIIAPINRILNTFYPFQRNVSLDGLVPPKIPIDTNNSRFCYIAEVRRHLAKAAQQFPKTRWSVHIHKVQNEGSNGMFTDHIFHTLQIDMLEKQALVTTPAGPATTKSLSSSSAKEDGQAEAPSPRPNYGDATTECEVYEM